MIHEQIEQKLQQIIDNQYPGVFIVDIQLNQGNATTLVIKVDTDQGISLDQCAKISRTLGKELEEEPWMDFPYRLEVSSPGVGYPLKLHRQYLNNIGRNLKVKLLDHTELRGRLAEVSDTDIVLEPIPKKGPKKKKQLPTIREPKKIEFTALQEAIVFIY